MVLPGKRWNKFYKIVIVLLSVTLINIRLFAQSGLLETNPPSVRWYKIKTPHFNVYFDKKINDQGNYVANLLQHVYGPVGYTLNTSPRRVSVILQNQTVFSNGFVSETPLRSEFYLYPPQDYNVDGLMKWEDLLSVHEFRHVVQFNKSLTGFNKFAFTLFGYEAAGTLSHLAVPDWFWEGDAVLTETALTHAGRGRDPEFSLLMKTNMIERGPFNYYLQYLRSFRYNVPDHYVTGYYFTSYLRRKYGSDAISRVLNKTWSWPFIPFRFSHELKKITGTNLVHNYNNMTRELDSLWHTQQAKIEITPVRRIEREGNKFYTDYKYPREISPGRYIVLRSGIDKVTAFVSLDSTGRKKQLFIPGLMDLTGNPTFAGNKIAWTEIEHDPRWPQRSYSVIKTYDIGTGKVTRLAKKTRYSSSALSPDGTKIVTLNVTDDLQYNLLIINAANGKIEEKIPNPGNFFYLTPAFSSDGKKIIAVRKSDDKKALWVYDLANKTSGIIYGPVHENIGVPCPYRNYAFYSSPVNGTDNIYVFDLSDEQVYQVTSVNYGAYNPAISSDGKKLIFNDFGKNGMDVAWMDLKKDHWIPVSKPVNKPAWYFQPVVDQESTHNVLANIPGKEYKVVKANRFASLFNPYGWGPYVAGSNLDLQVGIRMQDILSTSMMNAGYEFNANENTGKWFGSVSYQGLYPVINLSGYSGNRSVDQTFRITENNSTSDTTVNIQWKESGFLGGLLLPLNLTHSRYYENLNLSAYTGYNYITGYDFNLRHFNRQGNGQFLYNSFKIQYSRQRFRAKRDINSKFAQLLFVQYNFTPTGKDYSGRMLSGEGRFIFPGLFRHHSLNIRLGYLNQDLSTDMGSYWFSSPVAYPRGYSYTAYEQFWVSCANYLFPIAYPDLHIGPLVNIQRIYTNVFIDHGLGETSGNRYNLTSTGLEMYFDFNLMRYLPLFNAGFRYSYVPEAGSGVFQFLIGYFGI